MSSFGQDYVAGAPFSFALPRVILREQAKALSAVAESFFCAPASLMRACSQRSTGTQKSTQRKLSAFACFRDPDRIRTCDPQLRRLLLYPAELPDQSLHFGVRHDLMSKVDAKVMFFFGFAIDFVCYCFAARTYVVSSVLRLLITFPAISMPVTRKNPIRANTAALP